MVVRILVEIEIPPKNIKAFKESLRSLTQNIREKEALYVLAYDYFSTDAGTEKVFIQEVYRSCDDFVTHCTVFSGPIADFVSLFSVNSLIVVGKLTDDVLAQMKQFTPNFKYYPIAVSTLEGD
jgi:quinol monooxygenase YgiN